MVWFFLAIMFGSKNLVVYFYAKHRRKNTNPNQQSKND
ncbi:MAG: hypothetical protein Rsou_0979 [Candidatus Ruthia sp. Asou_11_S2]|nr:hypothetical protein [Candidatus Ruthia sp. Asou_11_S2]